VITTFCGLEVDPLHMKKDQILIEDLAHALALCNRFAGHSRFPISVAQHSVLVSFLSDPEQPFAGLLHDGSEAYLGDITKWLKMTPEMAAYRRAEAELQATIYSVFGIFNPRGPFETVEWADKIAVRFEFEQSFGHGQTVPGYSKLTSEEYMSLNETMESQFLWRPVMTWQEAEAAFLQRYRDLNR